MPSYYHVHRGIDPSRIEGGFAVDEYLFFAPRDESGGWNLSEKALGFEAYGGYREYKIKIPSERFTTSLAHGSSKGKIFRLTLDNLKEFSAELRKSATPVKGTKVVDFLNRNHKEGDEKGRFIGFDRTEIDLRKLPPSIATGSGEGFTSGDPVDGWTPEVHLIDVVVAPYWARWRGFKMNLVDLGK